MHIKSVGKVLFDNLEHLVAYMRDPPIRACMVHFQLSLTDGEAAEWQVSHTAWLRLIASCLTLLSDSFRASSHLSTPERQWKSGHIDTNHIANRKELSRIGESGRKACRGDEATRDG